MRAKIILFATLSCTALSALADTPQISRGVRVMMTSSTYEVSKKDDPKNYSFGVLGQVDILGVANKTGALQLSGPQDVLKFFTSLSPEVQEKGLWITHIGVSPTTQSDLDKLSELSDGATQRGLLMHFCKARTATTKGTGLGAWECNRVSPKKSAQPLICEPRIATGPSWAPLWDCSE